MEVRYPANPEDFKSYDTARMRREYLIQELFVPGRAKLVYSHSDRLIVGGVTPSEPVPLTAGDELRAEYFLERREMGIINVGGPGTVTADGVRYDLKTKDGLYLGKGVREVVFASADKANPAKFYLNSAPAHAVLPAQKVEISQATPNHLGSKAEANERTIYKYFHPDGVKSCQLVMGMTILETGCVWNTMPSHTHERRMEAYFYFGMAPNALVFHMMGQPGETRHVVMRSEEAILSPSWSIHSGVGTASYTFIWGMAGENQTFSDMDAVAMGDLL